MKKLLLTLLLAPLFFTACKKGDDSPAVKNEFIINGIHDVDMGVTGGNVLALAVTLTSGVQEPVTLSASGVPGSINVAFVPASGTPNFGTVATFTGTTAAGTYPIKIIGTSATYTKSYDLNLIVPALNGWTVDGTKYTKASYQRVSQAGYTVLSFTNASGMAELDFIKLGTLPTADGTYTYPVGDAFSTSTDIGVDFRDLSSSSANTYSNKVPAGTTVTLIISGGKVKVTLPATVISDGSIEKTLTADVSE